MGFAVLLPLLLVPQATAQQVDRLPSPRRYRTATRTSLDSHV
jgi:hypothetical protein